MIVAYDEKRKKGERVRRARSGAIGVEGLSTGWLLGSLVLDGIRALTEDVGVVQWHKGRIVGTHAGYVEGEAELSPRLMFVKTTFSLQPNFDLHL